MSYLSVLDVFPRKIVKTQDICIIRKKIVRLNVLNTMQPKGAKSVEKLRGYYRKTEKKSEKIEFLRKIRPRLRGCKASFYRKTTWQTFIFHQEKSFKQHTCEIGGGRGNCLVSWRGMTHIHIMYLLMIHGMYQCSIKKFSPENFPR